MYVFSCLFVNLQTNSGNWVIKIRWVFGNYIISLTLISLNYEQTYLQVAIRHSNIFPNFDTGVFLIKHNIECPYKKRNIARALLLTIILITFPYVQFWHPFRILAKLQNIRRERHPPPWPLVRPLLPSNRIGITCIEDQLAIKVSSHQKVYTY